MQFLYILSISHATLVYVNSNACSARRELQSKCTQKNFYIFALTFAGSSNYRVVFEKMDLYIIDMDSCVFCQIAAGKQPAWKVYEDERVIAFFDKGSIAEYHTLVIPKQHATNIFDIDESDFQAMASAIRHISQSFRENLGIDAIQIVSSNGAAAQQDVFHMHVHIVPRMNGDGQDISWTPDPSINERFDKLLPRAIVKPVAG